MIIHHAYGSSRSWQDSGFSSLDGTKKEVLTRLFVVWLDKPWRRTDLAIQTSTQFSAILEPRLWHMWKNLQVAQEKRWRLYTLFSVITDSLHTHFLYFWWRTFYINFFGQMPNLFKSIKWIEMSSRWYRVFDKLEDTIRIKWYIKDATTTIHTCL